MSDSKTRSQDRLRLKVLSGRFAVCRLAPETAFPDWLPWSSEFVSVTRTSDELSVVCAEGLVPRDVQAEKGWKCLMVEGPLDFSLVGILNRLLSPLAQAGISVFAVSTYDTDYLMVKEAQLECALEALGQEVEWR